MLTVKYFIPEDGDDIKHPNIFRVKTTGPQITLRQIKEAFPVPGVYHFRFLTSLGKNSVWMDVTDDNNAIPHKDGDYFSKVSRIQLPPSIERSPQKLASSKSSRPDHNSEGNQHQEAPSAAPAPQLLAQRSERLLSFDSEPNYPTKNNITSPPAAAADLIGEEDLLGFSSSLPATQESSSSSPSSSNMDLFGLESTPLSTSPLPPSQPSLNYFPPPSQSPMNQNQGGGRGRQIPTPGQMIGRGGYDAFSGLS
eukprot:CAMPEP_0182428506 /NCGR_PEP_ID=MMETSP1167-20130531/23070_1 /TAXON_ID=2988 /ORGANISM="Mallomonas Sp, Strain CCMP3275" /LENGTH=251 /DNA_ID=CAMNT_0024611445 /DNA_START=161 /DNA_END=913 /DNA_ORIENTATION=+